MKWKKVMDYQRGVEYYWNVETGATQWEEPPEGYIAEA